MNEPMTKEEAIEKFGEDFSEYDEGVICCICWKCEQRIYFEYSINFVLGDWDCPICGDHN